MADVEKLVVTLEASLKQYERELARAQRTTVSSLRKIERDAQKSVGGIERSFGLLGSAIKGAFAALSIERVASTILSVVKSVADIGDAADKLGFTTDQFQQLQFAAQLAGVEATSLAAGMKKLAVNSSDAARGQGELGDIFKANSVSIRDANGELLSQTEILALVAELVRNAASEQDQAAIAQAAFGKSGVDLLNLLEQGAAGVTRAMKEAEQSGVSFSEEQIRRAQKIDDEFDTLIQKVSVGLKSSFLDFVDTSVREWDAVSGAILTSKGYLDAWIASLGQAVQLSTQIGQTVAGGKGDREIPMTPGALGKGDLPSNIGSNFQLVRPTIIPSSTPRASGRTPRATRAPGSNEYQRGVQQIQENIKLLQAERDAILANVTATTGYDAAVEKARITEQLMNDARSAGLKITPKLSADIDQLAGAYAGMQQQVDEARAKHEAFVQSLEDTKQLSKDVLSGFVSDLRDGASAMDALNNALDKIIDSLLDMAINNLVESAFGGASSSSGGGLLGGLFGGLFGGGSSFAGLYAKGGQIPSGKWGIAGEAGPEIIRGPASVTPITRAANGGGRTIIINQTIAANGDKAVAEIAYAQTRRAIREAEAKRPEIDNERRLRMA